MKQYGSYSEHGTWNMGGGDHGIFVLIRQCAELLLCAINTKTELFCLFQWIGRNCSSGTENHFSILHSPLLRPGSGLCIQTNLSWGTSTRR